MYVRLCLWSTLRQLSAVEFHVAASPSGVYSPPPKLPSALYANRLYVCSPRRQLTFELDGIRLFSTRYLIFIPFYIPIQCKQHVYLYIAFEWP